MLYETLNQPKLFLIFLLTGLFGGFIFDIGNFIKLLLANKKITNILIDMIETILCISVVFFFNVNFNYGLLRLFPIITFFLSFCIERFTIGKIIAKIYLSCYNIIIKLNKRLWGKIKHDKTNKIN